MQHKEEFINLEIGPPYGSFHLNVQRMLSKKPLGPGLTRKPICWLRGELGPWRGLAIFSCMPTTLSSGLAGGNSALALAMTVISNLLGILIVPLFSSSFNPELFLHPSHSVEQMVLCWVVGCLVPFSISKFIADGVGVSVPTKQLLRSLVVTLLIPLILGKVIPSLPL
ncbi:putative sodium/metabolite cotransporter BASS4, chloroplastic [Vitis vinifera]|uniref:Putative sodium/metabolite cotransporter BASS4, chloroplastic n=1 Tax=Vitis vinifera TaxID=29760 RepID=A0A438IBZ4_VITVI|nr:putative sodium/metabolite cotransporter BASS4, chloroplastic [Vitis vinifera]